MQLNRKDNWQAKTLGKAPGYPMRSNVSRLAAYKKDNAGHELKVVVERVMR
jgi:hypothetical protein